MPERDPMATLRRLHGELVRRRPFINRAESYYDGDHNLAFASDKFLEAFGGLFEAFADNWCGVIPDAVEERMHVQGFRVRDEPRVDKAASEIWKRFEMETQSSMGHTDSQVAGAFYVTTWVGDDDRAEITVDSAATTIVECHPKIRTRRTAGLRCYVADDGYEHAELFYPDEVYMLRSRSKRTAGSVVDPLRTQWVIEDQLDISAELDASGRMPNPLGEVPIEEFLNRPRLTMSARAGFGAHSAIAAIMPLQDAVNKLLSDLLVASEFAAYPQRWLTGYEPDEVLDPNSGKPTGATIPPKFKNGAGILWWLEEAQARFGQFEAADLSSTVNSIEMVVNHIAAISRTPPHYLSTSADRLSGDSIKSAETGLIAKVNKVLRNFGPCWARVVHRAGVIEGIAELREPNSIETVWRDPETRTEAEHVDALGKKAQMLDVPKPQLWEEAGYTDDQIGRFPALRAQMQLEGMAAGAAQRARTATDEAARLRAASVEATGADPTAA